MSFPNCEGTLYIHQNHFGYAIQCRECQNIQLNLGTTVLVLTPAQIKNLAKSIEYLSVEHCRKSLPTGDHLVINTTCHQTFMCLKPAQLEGLQEILEHVVASLEVHELLFSD